MELVEAAAVVGASEATRTYFGQETAKISEFFDVARDYLSSLNSEWCWGWRTSLLTVFALFGTFSNCLFISSFKISYKLWNIGSENISLACLGWSDMIITALVFPLAVVLDTLEATESTIVCNFLQMLTLWSTYTYSVSYMVVSFDIYNRLGYDHRSSFDSSKFLTWAPVLLNFSLSLVTAVFGVFYNLDYDYCQRKHEGNFWFRLVTMGIFYVIPCFITTYLFLETTDLIRERLTKTHRFSQVKIIKKDRDLSLLHTTCYYLFVAGWIPYLVTVILFPDTSNDIYYALTWIGLLRSAITSSLYGAKNKNFRKAFASVLLYIFCNDKVTRPVRNRRLRRIETEARLQNNRILTRGAEERPARPTTPAS